MNKLVPLAFALTVTASSAFAQTAPAPAPATPPAATTSTSPPVPSATTPSTTASRDVMLTEEEARNWIDKVVYSKDDQNVGEVAAFNRDSSGKVIELHADIGGFMGLGERRVKLMPGQFSLQGDRVVLNITSEEVKALPAIAKN